MTGKYFVAFNVPQDIHCLRHHVRSAISSDGIELIGARSPAHLTVLAPRSLTSMEARGLAEKVNSMISRKQLQPTTVEVGSMSTFEQGYVYMEALGEQLKALIPYTVRELGYIPQRFEGDIPHITLARVEPRCLSRAFEIARKIPLMGSSTVVLDTLVLYEKMKGQPALPVERFELQPIAA